MAHKSSVNTMVASEKGNFLVSAGRDSSINIYNTTTLSPENLPKRVGVTEECEAVRDEGHRLHAGRQHGRASGRREYAGNK